MARLRTILLVGVLGGLLVAAPDDRFAEELRALKERFRKLRAAARQGLVPFEKQLDPLEEIARMRDISAEHFLVGLARREDVHELVPDILELLDRHKADSVVVADLFRGHLSASDPHRALARRFLVRAERRRGNTAWFEQLFRFRIGDDRFVALRGLGMMGATSTLPLAMELVRDKNWQPDYKTAKHCGTIAEAVSRQEGAAAARVLLLLRRDPRFGRRDVAALRDATRLWRERRLERYIRLEMLADPSRARRVEAARFMGGARIERARAPLMALASNPREEAIVRAAAIEALGGLRLSRAATLAFITRWARGSDATLRAGAIRGLVSLRTKSAAKLLIDLLPEAGGEARDALIELAGEPQTDWASWVANNDGALFDAG